MVRSHWLGLALTVSVLSFPITASAQSGADCVPPTGKSQKLADSRIDTDVYGDIIIKGFNNRYTGYAFVLHNAEGKRIFFSRAGWAVTKCDGRPLAFTLNTKAVWGSVSKVITTAAVLHAAERWGKGTSGPGRFVYLDTRFRFFLPARWGAEMHDSFDRVTVADLLRHKAGFRKSGKTDETIRIRLKNGVETEKGVGHRMYSNTSMGIFHYALAKMTNHANTMLDLEKSYKDATDAEYDKVMRAATGIAYWNYVQDNMFRPLNIDAKCDAEDFVPTNNYSKTYGLPNSDLGVRGGIYFEDVTPHCAAGGWVMSVKDMAKFLHALKHTNKLIGRDFYELMETGVANQDQMGWSTHSGAKGGTSFVHNGVRSENGRASRAQVIIYPNGYIAAFVANSPVNGKNLGVMLDAYNESLK